MLFLLHVGLEQCEVWGVKSAVWSVKCEGISGKWEVWSVECEVWSFSLECEERSVKCEVWSFSLECEGSSVKCEVWSVKFEVWSAKSAVWSVECEDFASSLAEKIKRLSREGHGRDRVSLNYRSFMFGKLPPPACPGLCYNYIYIHDMECSTRLISGPCLFCPALAIALVPVVQAPGTCQASP